MRSPREPLFTMLMSAGLALGCAGGEAEPPAIAEVTNASAPTSTLEESATARPTGTPVPPTDTLTPEPTATPMPKPTDTPEPTPTRTPQPVIEADASEFALTLDDLPSGFILEDVSSYTEPGYEPEFIDAQALIGMVSGQGIGYDNADLSLSNFFDIPIRIIQVGIVYETTDHAKDAMGLYVWRNPDEEIVPASGPKVGDESKSFVHQFVGMEKNEEDNLFDEDIDFRVFATQFRIGNAIAVVATMGVEGASVVDVTQQLVEAVEAKIVGLAK